MKCVLAALVAGALLVGCGGSDDGSDGGNAVEAPRGDWAVTESLLADQPGWNANLAHRARLVAEANGMTAKEAENCWQGKLLPGEWPKGCEVLARFERDNGLVERGSEELAKPAPKPKPQPEPELTAGQENALEVAQDYIDLSGFSKAGLIEQLSSSAGEGFSVADATFAANHVDVDYNAEAVEAAQDYLDIGGFSKSALIEQLSSPAGEQFTPAQAQYAANKVYGG